jgi:hypothetical protein
MLRLIIGLIAAFVIFSNYSCKKERSQNFPSPAAIKSSTEITAAKNWYNQSFPKNDIHKNPSTKIHSNSNTGAFDFSTVVSPDWEKAVQYERFGTSVIEVPIADSNNFITNVRTAESVQRQEVLSKSSFIILPAVNGYRAYIMIVVADSAYSKRGVAIFNKNTYAQKDSLFSGRILYYTPNGDFTSGYVFKNGLMSPIETMEQKRQQQAQAVKINLVPDPGSQPAPIDDVPPQTCTDWFVDTYVDHVLVSSEYVGTTCSSGSSGPVNGGGTAPPPTSDDYLKELLQKNPKFRDAYDKLNPTEKALFNQYPASAFAVFANAELSLQDAADVFAGYSQHNTIADAYRHALWNALNSHNLGTARAQLFGDAHEQVPNADQPTIEKTMDLYNNQVGRNAYVANVANPYILRAYIYNLAITGQLRMIENGVLVPTHL